MKNEKNPQNATLFNENELYGTTCRSGLIGRSFDENAAH